MFHFSVNDQSNSGTIMNLINNSFVNQNKTQSNSTQSGVLSFSETLKSSISRNRDENKQVTEANSESQKCFENKSNTENIKPEDKAVENKINSQKDLGKKKEKTGETKDVHDETSPDKSSSLKNLTEDLSDDKVKKLKLYKDIPEDLINALISAIESELNHSETKDLLNLDSAKSINIEELLSSLKEINLKESGINIDKSVLDKIQNLLSEFAENDKSKISKKDLKNIKNTLDKILKENSKPADSFKDISTENKKSEKELSENIETARFTKSKSKDNSTASSLNKISDKNDINADAKSNKTVPSETLNIKTTNTGNSENSFNFNGRDDSSNSALNKSNTNFTKLEQQSPKGALFKQQFNDILNKANLTVRDNGSSKMVMKMFPEKLGHLNVTLGMENGILTGRFLVDSPEARDLLMNDLELLKSKLAEQGVGVGSFEVNVKSGKKQFSANQNEDENNLKINYLNEKDINEEYIDVYEINENDYRSGYLNMVI